MMVPNSAILGNLGIKAPCTFEIVPTIDCDSPIDEVIASFLGSAIPKKTTARGYRRHLLNAFGVLAIERLSELLPGHLAGYRRYLLEDGRGTATHAQALISMRSFLGWCAAMRGHDLHMDQVLQLLKVPKVNVITPHETLSDKEILAVIATAEKMGFREHALIMVALGSGVRVAELVALDVRDMRHDASGGLTIHVRQGKGGKDRMIPVRREVRKTVENYLEFSGRKRGDLGPLFMSEDRAMSCRESWRLSTKSASRIVRSAAEMAGITKRITPHALRHTFAFTTYLFCKNLVAVQKLLGHATIATTQRYVCHLDELDLRRAIPATLSGCRVQKLNTESRDRKIAA